MNTEEAREAWCLALESREYAQTKAMLQGGKGYCCLGVACLVAEQNGIAVEREKYTGANRLVGSSLHRQEAVLLWLGLQDGAGAFEGEAGVSLVTLNDSQGMTFAEIAAVIRSNPRGLFL